ncbi:hypothetical protein [Streptomyces sp. NBC_00358]|uniref:hypothetical protein n=1 Tax=Streptomyces sp. NBC_00358 TaxID=2975725 RepID=UPI002E257BED
MDSTLNSSPGIADLGFTGLDDAPDNPVIITGFKAARTKPLATAKKQVNKLIAVERAACEHAFAHPKNWRIPTGSAFTPSTPPPSCGPSSSSRTLRSPADR